MNWMGLSALVLCGTQALAEATNAPVTSPTPSRHSLDVRLEPALHRLSAIARIELARADTSKPTTFLLNKQLTVTSVRDGHKPAAFSYGRPLPEARPLLVQLDQTSEGRGPREITIEYHGTIEKLRQQLAGEGARDPKMKLRIQLRLEEYEQLKAAIESFFGNTSREAELLRLMRDIAESADDIHDCIRDKTPQPIAAHLTQLTQAWEQFSQIVRTCSRIGY